MCVCVCDGTLSYTCVYVAIRGVFFFGYRTRVMTGWLLLLFVAVVPSWATPLCGSNITVSNATGCGVLLHIGGVELPFPLGNTSTVLTVNNSQCVQHVSVQLDPVLEWKLEDENATLCGPGVCTTTAPYRCECPPPTIGAFCCYSFNSVDVCGGHGDCAAGATCVCDSWSGGDWCCPRTNGTLFLNDTSLEVDVCGGDLQGCCLANGTCECASGWTGSDCLSLTSTAAASITVFDHIASTTAIIAIAVASTVIGVAAITVGVAALSATAGAGAGAGAGGAGAALFIGGRPRVQLTARDFPNM